MQIHPERVYPRKVASGEGNVCLSPYSISAALAMTLDGAEGETRRQAFGALAEGYWRPVYKYVRWHWRADPAEAEDLTQGFFARAYEKRFFDRFEAARGRFRTFLRTCVDGYVANEFGTMTELAESPIIPGILWAGTDDGNIQLSRDGGTNWEEVGKNIPGVEIDTSLAGKGTAPFVRCRHDSILPPALAGSGRAATSAIRCSVASGAPARRCFHKVTRGSSFTVSCSAAPLRFSSALVRGVLMGDLLYDDVTVIPYLRLCSDARSGRVGVKSVGGGGSGGRTRPAFASAASSWRRCLNSLSFRDRVSHRPLSLRGSAERG
jgi:hypothetical protein